VIAFNIPKSQLFILVKFFPNRENNIINVQHSSIALSTFKYPDFDSSW